ncbi:MAG: hypothetical protein GVY31_07540 [Alphaproteobacteria bacterium]|nr:hypothetical protein [Alphaproteobacteria bacterium]
MKPLLPASLFLLAGTVGAQAQTDYSALLRDQGLAAAETTLAAISTPTPSDHFALGGVRFLGAVETALQAIHDTRIDPDMGRNSGLPFLGLPVAPNPDAAPFRPALVEEVFVTALDDLDASLAALDPISDDDDVSVVIDTADIWFDVNDNGWRDAGEGFYDIAAPQLARNMGGDADVAPPVVHFDTADAAWLSAYGHLLSGSSETILALDPTTAISRVVDSAAALSTINGGNHTRFFSPNDAQWVDLLAMFIHAIEGQPDTARSRAAHGHFLAMIEDNRTFWTRVARETDNDREWIPNAGQQSALPLEFPPETGETWQMVLAEAEAALRGELLIPHWRLGPNAGIDLAAAMQDPPEIDIVAMIQGEGILPYARTGPRMSGDSLQMFRRLMGRDAALFMVILN